MRNRLIFTGIILFCVIINMPAVLNIAGLKFYRPSINLNLLGRPFIRDLDFRLGLDLQGGTHLVYLLDTSNIGSDNRAQAVTATRNNIEKRINLLGVSEALVQTSAVGNEHRLIIELPGIKDVNQAIATIGQTAQLDFRLPNTATPSSAADFTSTGLSGQDLHLAQVQFDSNQVGSGPVIGLEFSPEGSEKFAKITKENIGKPVAIFLDDQLLTAPTVQNEITDGKAIITGSYSIDEAKNLVIQLNAGALPVPIKIVEQRNIGATLGTESIIKSLFAGVVGFVLVLLFMIFNYGLKGLLADIALVIYVFMSLALFKLIPITLTLAGIAGFILSVGMAVDANILIFERIKEELNWGRPMRAAVELGFHRAWTSVRDSNASSLITALILFWFGSGSVRGFALTLTVGILVSLFTSITITRSLVRAVYGDKK